MYLDKIYKFNWKLQNKTWDTDFLSFKIPETAIKELSDWMRDILHNFCYQWKDRILIFNDQVDEEIAPKQKPWYYTHIGNSLEFSSYFLSTCRTGSYAFDKELFKLFYVDSIIWKSNPKEKFRFYYMLYYGIPWLFETSQFKDYKEMRAFLEMPDLTTIVEELDALVWLWVFHNYVKQISERIPSCSKLVDWYIKKHDCVGEMFTRSPWIKWSYLPLFYTDELGNICQTKTFMNPDFKAFSNYMVKFCVNYWIPDELWGLFIVNLHYYKDDHSAIIETWKHAIKKWFDKNKNTLGFFYIFFKFAGVPYYYEDSFLDRLIPQKWSWDWLYKELKNNEEYLIETFSTASSVLAYMSFEFFTTFMFFTQLHHKYIEQNDNIKWKDRTTIIVSELDTICSQYRNVISPWIYPSESYFYDKWVSPVQTISRKEFLEKNNQIFCLLVSKIQKDWVDLDPIKKNPLLLTFYSKNRYKLDQLVPWKQTITPSFEQKMIDKNSELKKTLEVKIEYSGNIQQITNKQEEQTQVIREKEIIQDEKEQKASSVDTTNVKDKWSIEDFGSSKEITPFTTEELYQELKRHIFWQDAILEHIAMKIHAYLFLKKENNKPLTFFLVWPPWTWKTYLSEVLVKVLNNFIKDEENKFNAQSEMATNYQDKSSLSKLLWATAWYVWHWDKLNFFEELLKKDNQIILFDEIEKWDPSLYPFFLDFINNGKLESNDWEYWIYMWQDIAFKPKGNQVKHLRNVILIFASNSITSPEEVKKLSWEDFKPILKNKDFKANFVIQNRTLRNALRNWKNGNKTMDNAYLDRLQLIYLFNPLSENALKDIVLNKFNKILAEFNINNWEKKTIEKKFMKDFFNQEEIANMKDASSMREIQAIIEDWIINNLSDMRQKS